MADDIATFPVTGWEIKSVPALDALLLRFPFLSHATQKIEEADPGRNYILTTTQAAELRDAIDRAIQKMKSGGTPPNPVPKH